MDADFHVVASLEVATRIVHLIVVVEVAQGAVVVRVVEVPGAVGTMVAGGAITMTIHTAHHLMDLAIIVLTIAPTAIATTPAEVPSSEIPAETFGHRIGSACEMTIRYFSV